MLITPALFLLVSRRIHDTLPQGPQQSLTLPGRIMFPLIITAEKNEEFFLPRYGNRKKS